MTTKPRTTSINGHDVVAGHIPGERIMYVMSTTSWDFVTFRMGEPSGVALDDLTKRIEESESFDRRIDQMVTDVDTAMNRAANKRWWWQWW